MARINNNHSTNKATNNHGISNRGKLVFCKETHQIFESAKATAKTHDIPYSTLVSHLNGVSKSTNGMHFVYIENTADLSVFFSEQRKADQEAAQAREAARKEAEVAIQQEQEAIEAAKELIRQATARKASAVRRLKKLS